MKKLTIAIVATVVGFVAGAATFNWEVQKGYIYDGANEPAKMTSGTAYLLFTSVLKQNELVAAFAADATKAASTVSTKALSTGIIGSDARIEKSANFTPDVTEDQTAYFVIFNGDNMYVSITAEAAYTIVGEESISFASVSSSSKTFNDVSGGYKDAGWYGTASVPEPTSGLLLLIGVAGLALKRKRA